MSIECGCAKRISLRGVAEGLESRQKPAGELYYEIALFVAAIGLLVGSDICSGEPIAICC